MKLSNRLAYIMDEKRGDKGDVFGKQGDPSRLKVLDVIDDILSDKDYWYLSVNSSHGEKIITGVSNKASSKYGPGVGKKFDAKKFADRLSTSGTKWKPVKGSGADWEFAIDESIGSGDSMEENKEVKKPSLIEEIESILGGSVVVNLVPKVEDPVDVVEESLDPKTKKFKEEKLKEAKYKLDQAMVEYKDLKSINVKPNTGHSWLVNTNVKNASSSIDLWSSNLQNLEQLPDEEWKWWSDNTNE